MWTPLRASVVLGVAFVSVTLLFGAAWTHTDTLTSLASRTPLADVWSRLLLFATLLLGAVVAGAATGTRVRLPQDLRRLVRCLGGGALMAVGSLLVPGSNDNLLLFGLPLLQPTAWLAFITMCLVIAAASFASRRG